LRKNGNLFNKGALAGFRNRSFKGDKSGVRIGLSINLVTTSAISSSLAALDTATESALQIKTYKLLRSLEIAVGLVFCVFGCWLWVQAK
jgi:hypothetical protein